MELIIIRHAQPQTSKVSDGPADPALTALGRTQAEVAARWLARDGALPVDRVVSSPMRRALQTAEPTARVFGRDTVVDERLAEFDVGGREYVPVESAGPDVHDQVDTALTTGRWGRHRFDPDEFRSRVLAAFADLAAHPTSRRVAVFCHGGVINTYLSALLERRQGMFFRPAYTSISRVEITAGSPRLVCINEIPRELRES